MENCGSFKSFGFIYIYRIYIDNNNNVVVVVVVQFWLVYCKIEEIVRSILWSVFTLIKCLGFQFLFGQIYSNLVKIWIWP